MLAGDLLLVRPDEHAAPDDVLPADDQAIDAMGAAQDEVRDEILRAAEPEAVRAPDRQVGPLPGLERANVGPPQHLRPAACAEPKGLSRRHRLAAAAPSRDEE